MPESLVLCHFNIKYLRNRMSDWNYFFSSGIFSARSRAYWIYKEIQTYDLANRATLSGSVLVGKLVDLLQGKLRTMDGILGHWNVKWNIQAWSPLLWLWKNNCLSALSVIQVLDLVPECIVLLHTMAILNSFPNHQDLL